MKASPQPRSSSKLSLFHLFRAWKEVWPRLGRFEHPERPRARNPILQQVKTVHDTESKIMKREKADKAWKMQKYFWEIFENYPFDKRQILTDSDRGQMNHSFLRKDRNLHLKSITVTRKS